MLPSISGTIGSALALLDVAKDPRVRDVVKRASSAASSVRKRVPFIEPEKKSAGPGRYILIGLGVVATLGVLYAAWQTLRADDDLWIEDLGDPAADVSAGDGE